MKHGGYYYYYRNDGLQNQSVLYRQAALDGESEVFLDPNKLSDDGTVALGSISFSEDGKYFAYSVSQSGSDWVEINVINTDNKEKLPDVIKWVKNSGANWGADSKGFYYSRYDEPDKRSELSGQNRFQKVYYHKLGDDQSKDRLIYADSEHPLRYFHGSESEDGKYVFIDVSEGTNGSEILYRKNTGKDTRFEVLLPGFRYNYGLVDCIDDKLYVLTDDGAPNYRLAVMNLNDPKPVLTDIIPENPKVLLSRAGTVGGNIVVFYLEDAQHAVYQYDMDGKLIRKVELPAIGSVGGFGGKKEAEETFYSLTSFVSPATIYRYDIKTGESTLLRAPEVNYDPSLYTSEQVFFTSKDGTRVPMFIVHRKDMKKNGKNPLLLYGYGGFNNSVTPGFNPSNIMFMEQGGIYVLVNLRGGGEYGEEWHRAGMLENKQNVFDDFIAAAEYLIANKYTSRKHIAINGGSNGGLLVGACMTQRPELFAVALPAVGVMDMLRYHKFTVGWGWAVEYGSSDDPEQFEYIYKYSPLHNIKEGVCYPATMITTGDHDDRVVPAHSFKFASTLQKAQGCDKPVLIRISVKAGHGAGKPTSMRLEEAADMNGMKVFKFGGASVKSAEGVRNLRRIAGGESGELFIIISAMGKTTNALETVTDHFIKGEREAASAAFSLLTGYHENICRELFDGRCPAAVAALFSEVADILENAEPSCSEFEKWYDRIVSYGEMLSTAIVSEYLNLDGVENRLLDMRRLFVTDRRHRDANIDMDVSSVLLKAEIADSPFKVFVGQGFIGGTPEGKPTTLGREGSDYSAAVAAYILDAESRYGSYSRADISGCDRTGLQRGADNPPEDHQTPAEQEYPSLCAAFRRSLETRERHKGGDGHKGGYSDPDPET
ncbi:prolyl endopeptidase [Holotrichia oblita]|uniref:Prolyl endopeptidase n=1 Tax=Holotrichia oblita TaxID=644536 RepID=A0ACB9TRJ5_HOLOL|nr:prolyl endopeptidase [Holotrichia oblita]